MAHFRSRLHISIGLRSKLWLDFCFCSSVVVLTKAAIYFLHSLFQGLLFSRHYMVYIYQKGPLLACMSTCPFFFPLCNTLDYTRCFSHNRDGSHLFIYWKTVSVFSLWYLFSVVTLNVQYILIHSSYKNHGTTIQESGVSKIFVFFFF